MGSLWKFTKKILLLSHGQASGERGSSINKEISVENMTAQTLISQGVGKDHLMSARGVNKDHQLSVGGVSKDYLLSVGGFSKDCHLSVGWVSKAPSTECWRGQ